MRRILLLILLSVVSAGVIHGRVTRTTRKGLERAEKCVVPEKSTLDTITDRAMIKVRISGYDKPLRSMKESLFVTNDCQDTIICVSLKMDYTDMSGRQLHRTVNTISCNIPPGQTRQLSFSSWDRQQSFYYKLSSRSKRADGTPYDVACVAEMLVVIP